MNEPRGQTPRLIRPGFVKDGTGAMAVTSNTHEA